MLRIPAITSESDIAPNFNIVPSVPMAEDEVTSLTSALGKTSLGANGFSLTGMAAAAKTSYAPDRSRLQEVLDEEAATIQKAEDDKNQRKLVCQNCKAEALLQKRCIRCKKVTYCNRECQISHWPDHKKTCIAVELIGQTKEASKEEEVVERAQIPKTKTSAFQTSHIASLVSTKTYIKNCVGEKNPVFIFADKNSGLYAGMRRIPNFIKDTGTDIYNVDENASAEVKASHKSKVSFVVPLAELARKFPQLPICEDFAKIRKGIPRCWFFIDFGSDGDETFQAGPMERVSFVKKEPSSK
jgi:hypothetical protein